MIHIVRKSCVNINSGLVATCVIWTSISFFYFVSITTRLCLLAWISLGSPWFTCPQQSWTAKRTESQAMTRREMTGQLLSLSYSGRRCAGRSLGFALSKFPRLSQKSEQPPRLMKTHTEGRVSCWTYINLCRS